MNKQHVMVAFAVGIVSAFGGVQIIAAVFPGASGLVNAMEGAACGNAIAAQIQFSSKQIMECVADKSRCEGELKARSSE